MEDDDEVRPKSLHVTEGSLNFRFEDSTRRRVARRPGPVEIDAGTARPRALGCAIGVEILEQPHRRVLGVTCVGELDPNLPQFAEPLGLIAVDSGNEINPTWSVPEGTRGDRASFT